MMLVYAAVLTEGDEPVEDELMRILSSYGEPNIVAEEKAAAGVVGGFRGGGRAVCEAKRLGGCLDVVDGLFAGSYGVDLHEALSSGRMPLGHYTLLHVEGGAITCARDHLGCRPLFMGRRGGLLAVSNVPNVINMMGVSPEPVQPASILRINASGVSARPYWRPAPVRRCGEGGLANLLRDALLESVKLLVERRAGLFFSGGLDSSVLAKLCIDLGLEPVLIASGMPDARDWRNIREAADHLGAEVMEVEITQRDLENAVKELEHLLGRLPVMDAAIGSVFSIQARRLSEAGVRQAVAGQGADELFGGYMKYLRILEERGYGGLGEALAEDVFNLHRLGLPRDSLACKLAGVELALPYLLPTVAELGLGIPPELKLRRTGGDAVVRKYILRRVAESLGLGRIAHVEKSALQYGTGVSKAVARMMKLWGRS